MRALSRAYKALRFRSRSESKSDAFPGRESRVFDGQTALGLLATQIDDGAGLVTWDGEAAGALAGALGLAMSGARASVLLTGNEASACTHTIAYAASHQLPIVIHLACGFCPGSSTVRNDGHDAYHLLSETGAITFFAQNVQEAVDLSILARYVAEQMLLPVVVAMDYEQTFSALQEVGMPDSDVLLGYLGDPDDEIEVPTPAQELLFGIVRRRVPRAFDLDRPVLLGAVQGAESAGHAARARQTFVFDHVPEILERALDAFEGAFGRRLDLFFEHDVDDCDDLVVVQGAASESVCEVARHLRDVSNRRVGVLGLRCLRPFPSTELARRIHGKSRVYVLERIQPAGAGDTPLTREIRALFDRCRENDRHGSATHPGHPSWPASKIPRVTVVTYGLGGLPLRTGDLVWLLSSANELPGPLHLSHERGTDSGRTHPKRQVLRDTLRRSYPETGFEMIGKTPSITPAEALRIEIHRIHRMGGGTLAARMAELLLPLRGTRVRSRIAEPNGPWGVRCSDRVEVGDAFLCDRDEPSPTDLSIVAPIDPVSDGEPSLPIRAASATLGTDALGQLKAGGALLLVTDGDSDRVSTQMSASLKARIVELKIALFTVDSRGLAGTPLEERILGAAIGLLSGRDRKIQPAEAIRQRGVFLGEFSEALLPHFESAIEAAVAFDPKLLAGDEGTQPPTARTPLAVREIKRTDARLDSLPRFWDQVGVLYRSEELDQLSPDPYLASGVVPPLSSCFHDVSGSHLFIPEFDPGICTGCGDCWPTCPDGALAPVSVGFAGILETGISMARETGADAGALRALIRQIAPKANQVLERAETPPANAGEILREVFPELLDAMAPSDERRETLEVAFDAVVDAVGSFPIARTAPFFSEPESKTSGTGELLSLAINPDACKGCQSCIHACPVGALRPVLQTVDVRARSRRIWSIWEAMPDSSGKTIERLSEHSEVGPMASVLLSRHSLLSMVGGDGAEAGSGEKLALRLVLATTEAHLQPRLQELIAKVAAVRSEVESAVRDALMSSFDGSLDSLGQGIEELGSSKFELSALADRLESDPTRAKLDSRRVSELVQLGLQLGRIESTLAEGVNGFGRARYGLVLGEGTIATWAARFPLNPFQVPVALDATGESPALVRGLLEGQLASTLDIFKKLRRASVLLAQKSGQVRANETSELAGWRELDPEERRLCPPVLLIADEKTIGSHFGALTPLLETDLPVRILALSGLGGDLGRDFGGFPQKVRSIGSVGGPGIVALAQRRAFVAQSSIAHPDHLVNSVRRALDSPRPALIHLHAPSPFRHGVAAHSAVEQSALAVDARVVPLFVYDPGRAGVFGSRLELDGNRTVEEMWVSDGEGRPISPVEWARRESRFEAHFSPLADSDPKPTPLVDYIALPERDRTDRTPFVAGPSQGRTRVSPEFVDLTEHHAGLWRTLQEIAGVKTPFTEEVERQITEKLDQEHQRVRSLLEAEHAARLQSIRNEVESEIVERVGERLLRLAEEASP